MEKRILDMSMAVEAKAAVLGMNVGRDATEVANTEIMVPLIWIGQLVQIAVELDAQVKRLEQRIRNLEGEIARGGRV